MKLLEYRATLPWDIDAEVVERLRGLGAVDFQYTIEGLSRKEVIRDVTDELMGWHVTLTDPTWWERNLSRGRRAV